MKQVVLVDDHYSFRRALALVLSREPEIMVVAQAGTVVEGRETIGNESDIDVAVMDLGLPDGDGIELIEELRESNPDISILVLTVDLNPKRIERALEAGANEVIGKESSIQTIVEAVKRAGEV